ncbi:MAG TPA: hypothetical protein VN442_26665 [Bryobacteraceae bacterium]|nr:hypothetical protein [Bryobacteraceae bacterium]
MSTAPKRTATVGAGWAAAVRILLFCGAAAFAAAILSDVLRYSVDVPFWDQWDFVRLLREISAGDLSWARLLFTSQGEHQIGMQVLLSAAGWMLTGMYMPAVMVANWGTAALFCVLALAVTRRALPPNSTIPWLVLGASSFFVFNPAAYQVWLWGLPLVHLLVPLLFLAGVFAAQSAIPDRLKIVVAAVAAAAASFILTSGLLLWAMFPPLLWRWAAPHPFRRERAGTVLFGLALVVSVAPYAMGPHTSPAPAGAPSGPGVMARFFLAYTGNLVSLAKELTPVGWAQLAGAGLLLFLLAAGALAARELHRKPAWGALLIWGAVGGYSILAGAMVTLGRHRFGVPYAVESSRYVLASSFLPIACVAVGCLLVAALVDRQPARRYLFWCVLSGTVVLVLSAGAFRVLQLDRARALMEHGHYRQLSGKVAASAANVANLPQFHNIYSTDNHADFVLSANYLNRRGWLRPLMWDQRFLEQLASAHPEPAFGTVSAATVTSETLRLSGRAHLAGGERAHAVIVAAIEGRGARILGVLFPGDLAWSGEVAVGPPGSTIRCFAYQAETGEVHLLAGERKL